MNSFHTPVLLKEVIDTLRIKKDEKYIDATLGGGGDSFEMVRRGGKVLGIDCDEEAIEYVKSKIRNSKFEIRNLRLVRGNFRDLKKIALSNGFEKVKGILFDLGVSSHQLESRTRGFSFQRDAPLDMRMDPSGASGQVKASDLINGLTRKELYELFNKLAQESNSWAISNSLVRARKIRPITTTKQLADLVISVYKRKGMRRSRIHPATKVFQALRIAVNDELGSLREALPQALELLSVGGRLVVISFHSLEDGMVKNFAKQHFLTGELKILTEKPLTPTSEEIRLNPRSQSAKMRVLEKI